MCDCCLTRLCDICGDRIQGGNYHCPKCNICICYYCAMKAILKGKARTVKCPMCGQEMK